MEKTLSDWAYREILKMQQSELDEQQIYLKIAARQKDSHNREILTRLANEEGAHHDIWAKYTKKQLKPNGFKVWFYSFMSIIFGFTFMIKLMENAEQGAQDIYEKLAEEVPQSLTIKMQEEEHEQALLSMLDEERLQYVGSMVLGLNDALVELTGTLAGLTLAMQNTQLIALSGLITGISATLSMASSEFLSARSEGRSDALKSCCYTGAAYLVTVAMLVFPYLIFPEHQFMYALGLMLINVVLIILVFNYYIAVAKDLPFKSRFVEMASISLGVAALSFFVGLGVKNVLGIDI